MQQHRSAGQATGDGGGWGRGQRGQRGQRARGLRCGGEVDGGRW